MAKSYSRNRGTPDVPTVSGRTAAGRHHGVILPVSTKQLLPGMLALASAAMMFVLAACQPASASWNAGLPGAVFRMPAGAWAFGMGGAVSADPDYMISWYNPSQLPSLRDRRASVGAGLRSLGRAESWASYDFRVPPRVGMGVSFVYRGDPFISGLYDGYYSENGEVVEERALNPAAWSAVSLKVGAGYMVSRQWSVGGSAAVNYQSLPTAPGPDGAIERSSVASIGALDIAASYKVNGALTLSAAVRSLLARNDWVLFSHDDYFSPAVEETVPPVFVLSSSHKSTLLERELAWGAEAAIHLFDGLGGYLGHPEAAVSAGARWKFTDELTLRAGLADMELSGAVLWDGERFWDSFSPRVTFGFSYAIPRLRRGAVFNYAAATDRVWAGVDQQVDITVSF